MVIAPDLRLAGSSTELLVGVQAALTLSVENAGPFSATDVKFTATLPASSTAITVQPGAGYDCALSGQSLSCSVGALRTGEFRNVVVGLTPAAHGQTAIAAVGAYETDETPGNNSFQRLTERRSNLAAQLTSSAAAVETGTTFTYTATVSNAGPSPAATLVAAVQLPANVTFSAVTANGLACAHAARVVTCNAAALAVGAS